jgi:hypothetical protein
MVQVPTVFLHTTSFSVLVRTHGYTENGLGGRTPENGY